MSLYEEDLRYHGQANLYDDRLFPKQWEAGEIPSVLVIQDCNMAGEYLRYYFDHEGKPWQVIGDVKATGPGVPPLVEFRQSRMTELGIPHPATGKTIRCKREDEFAWRFTLE
jgi:hypothetical protein